MRHHLACLALGFGILSACTGTSGPAAESIPPLQSSIDFGLSRGDQPTTRKITVPKPFLPPGTAELVSGGSGAFSPAAAALPAMADSGLEFTFNVTFSPAALAQEGSATETMTLRFTKSGGGFTRDVVVEISSTIESARILLDTPNADFGRVAVGEEVGMTLLISNPNAATPVELLSASPLPAGYSFGSVGGTFPAVIYPGTTQRIQLNSRPSGTGANDFVLRIVHGLGGTFDIPVHTEGIPPEVVIDLGDVDMTEFDPVSGLYSTPELAVTLSAEAASMTVELEGAGPFDIYTPAEWIGPGGHVYVDPADPFFEASPWYNYDLHGLFPLYEWQGRSDPTFQLPNGDNPDVQLVPGGGTYRFRIGSYFGDETSVHVRVLVEQRHNRFRGALDLNVFLANGLTAKAADAAGDPKIQQLLGTMDQIYSRIGIRLGRVAYYDIASPAFDDISTDTELQALQAESGMAAEVRMNLFLVRTASGDLDGILGIAGAIPGRKANGTTDSGVMLTMDGTTGVVAGSTAAHECGHFLGLWHTSQFDSLGDRYAADPILDTEVCELFPTPECSTLGNNYLMWPYDLPIGASQWVVTPGQGIVLRGHTLVAPWSPQTGSQLAAISGAQLAQAAAELGPAKRWCANCAGAR